MSELFSARSPFYTIVGHGKDEPVTESAPPATLTVGLASQLNHPRKLQLAFSKPQESVRLSPQVAREVAATLVEFADRIDASTLDELVDYTDPR